MVKKKLTHCDELNEVGINRYYKPPLDGDTLWR